MSFKAVTITPKDQRCWRAENPLLCNRVVDLARVVSDVRRLDFGDVQAARLLRDESATVLLYKVRVFVEDPGKCQLWNGHKNN